MFRRVSAQPAMDNANPADNGEPIVTPQDVQLQNTEEPRLEAREEDKVTLQRKTLIIVISVFVCIIIFSVGGNIFTGLKLMELNKVVNDEAPNEIAVKEDLPTLSRKRGIVPENVWRWIVEAKADLTLDPNSAHMYLEVSSDGKSLLRASPSSPPRVSTPETYQICICVSSKNFLDTRAYFELQVTQTVPWTIGLHTASFDADTNPDTDPGIWTIGSEKGKIIISYGETNTTSHATPSKLGLYLDYSRGQVSFYNAVTRLHLYSFQKVVTFDEKLKFYASIQTSDTDEFKQPFLTII